MGGYGVDVSLVEQPISYPCTTQNGRVYWANKKYNVPSYVIADARDSLEYLNGNQTRPFFFHHETGTYVRLISVNGIGEVRWTVDPLICSYGPDLAAAIHFGLIDTP
jgi:hypothetical protein